MSEAATTRPMGNMICPQCKELSANLYFDIEDIEAGVWVRCERCSYAKQELNVLTAKEERMGV